MMTCNGKAMSKVMGWGIVTTRLVVVLDDIVKTGLINVIIL
jgi:hypothetical protein